jgi:hypothetical protein
MNQKILPVLTGIRGFTELRRYVLFWIIGICAGILPWNLKAQETSESALLRTQTITLKSGWNAVYLEVEPDDSDPGVVFKDAPVDMAASYFGSKSSVQYVTDPSVDLFKNLGWAVWYKGDRPDSFLTSMDAIYGRRAYLVHSLSDAQWNVEGTARKNETEWRTDQFNLVGFPLASPGAPSYAEFFKAAKGLRTDRIYRLIGGVWKKVTNAAATPMRSGEAFWIYCDGPCRYRGPLEVETKFRSGLAMADGGTDSLILRNVSNDPIEVTIEHVDQVSNPVPLSLMVKVVGAPSALVSNVAIEQPSGAWTEVFTLNAGEKLALPFAVRVAEMNSSLQVSVLKVSTALGTESWVPVAATRSDLSESE